MTANDALLFNVVVDGQKRLLWIPLDLKPQTSKTFTVQYLRALDSGVISICGDRPTQIVEDPQPVVMVVVEEEPAEF